MTDSKQTRLTPLRRFIAEANDMTLIGLLLITLGGVLFICVLAVFLTDRWRGPQTAVPAASNPAAVQADPANDRPSAVAQSAVDTAAAADTTTVVLDTGAQTTDIQIPPPTLLQVDEQSLPIHPETISGAHILQGTVYEQVRWVENTIVNYVLQLPVTPLNQQTLENLSEGDMIQLLTNLGESKEFVVTTVTQAPVNEALFAQKEPSITLILPGETPLVVYGQYLLAPGEDVAAAPPTVALGETAAIGDASLTVRSATQLADDTAAVPPGYVAYEVEYQLTNEGSEPLDSGWFNLALLDQTGNRYSNQQQVTNAALLQGGQTALQTAVYQIPTTLPAQSFTLHASRVDTPDTLEIALPYTQPTAHTNPVVLQEAQLSADGTTLLLLGEIRNLSTESVVIQPNELTLTDQLEQTYFILETDPPLPWVVEPGNTQPFFLRTQRPDAAEAIFRIHRQSFALQNLR